MDIEGRMIIVLLPSLIYLLRGTDMEKRAMKILGEIVSQPVVSIKEIAIKYNLTKAQVEYALKKVNQILIEHRYEVIDRSNNHLQVSLSIEDYLGLVEKQNKDLYYSDSDRKNIILFMLLLQNDISLSHFTIELDVSKNTILKNLKEIESFLKVRKLSLIYSRKEGYVIKGNELRIRHLLIEIIKKMDLNDPWLINFFELIDNDSTDYTKVIQEIENSLEVRFSDEIISQLPFMMAAIKIRALNYSPLTVDHMPDLCLLWKERSYILVKNILDTYLVTDHLNSFDSAFIIIQILGGNLVLSNTKLHDNDVYVMAIKEVVRRFENMMAVTLHNKEELYNRLYQHLIPANYRLKYGTPLSNPLADKVKTEYKFIHSIVQKAIFPVEEVMECDFFDDELMYITLIFASSFYYQKSHTTKKLKAVVLCENGLSISVLLTNVLKELFPEIVFVESMSKRTYLERNMDIDLIFSTVYIRSEVPVYVVNPFLNDDEKQNLRQRVYFQISGIKVHDATVHDLIDIVEEFANVSDYKGLEKRLQQYLMADRNPTNFQKPDSLSSPPKLKDLICKDTIQIATEELTFEEAIHVAAQPLIDRNYISSSYRDRIIDHYHKGESYFIISPLVAIPHSNNKGDVYKVGMSLLKLQTPIFFKNEQQWVDILIIIAPFDQRSHIESVTQLHHMMLNKENVSNITNATSENEILTTFQQMLSRV